MSESEDSCTCPEDDADESYGPEYSSYTDSSEDDCDLDNCLAFLIGNQQRLAPTYNAPAQGAHQLDGTYNVPAQAHHLDGTYNVPAQANHRDGTYNVPAQAHHPDGTYNVPAQANYRDGTYNVPAQASHLDGTYNVQPQAQILDGTFSVLPGTGMVPPEEEHDGTYNVLPESDYNVISCPFSTIESEELSQLGLVSGFLSDDMSDLKWIDRTQEYYSPVDMAGLAERLAREPPPPESSAIGRAREQAAMLKTPFKWPPDENRQPYIGNTFHERSEFEQAEHYCNCPVFGPRPEYEDPHEYGDKTYSFTGDSFPNAWVPSPVGSPGPHSPFAPPATSTPQEGLQPQAVWKNFQGQFDIDMRDAEGAAYRTPPGKNIPRERSPQRPTDQQQIKCVCDDDEQQFQTPVGQNIPREGIPKRPASHHSTTDDGQVTYHTLGYEDSSPRTPPTQRPQNVMQRWGGQQDLRVKTSGGADYQTPVGQMIPKGGIPKRPADQQQIKCVCDDDEQQFQTPAGQNIPREGYPKRPVSQHSTADDAQLTYHTLGYEDSSPSPPAQRPQTGMQRWGGLQNLRDESSGGPDRTPVGQMIPKGGIPKRPVAEQPRPRVQAPAPAGSQRPTGGQVPSTTRDQGPSARPPLPPTRSQSSRDQIKCTCPPKPTTSKSGIPQGPPRPPIQGPSPRLPMATSTPRAPQGQGPPRPPTQGPSPRLPMATSTPRAPQGQGPPRPPTQGPSPRLPMATSTPRAPQGQGPPRPPTQGSSARPPAYPTRSQPDRQQIKCTCPPPGSSRTRTPQGQGPPTRPPGQGPSARPPVATMRSQPGRQQERICECPPKPTASKTGIPQRQGQRLSAQGPSARPPVAPTSSQPGQQQERICECPPKQTAPKTGMPQGQGLHRLSAQAPSARPPVAPTSSQPGRQQERICECPPKQTASKTGIPQGQGLHRLPAQAPSARPPVAPTSSQPGRQQERICECPPKETASKTGIPQGQGLHRLSGQPLYTSTPIGSVSSQTGGQQPATSRNRIPQGQEPPRPASQPLYTSTPMRPVSSQPGEQQPGTSRTRIPQGQGPPRPAAQAPSARSPVAPTSSQPGGQQERICECPPKQTASTTGIPPGQGLHRLSGQPLYTSTPIGSVSSQTGGQQPATSRTRIPQGQGPPRPANQQPPRRAPVQTSGLQQGAGPSRQPPGQQLPARPPIEPTRSQPKSCACPPAKMQGPPPQGQSYGTQKPTVERGQPPAGPQSRIPASMGTQSQEPKAVLFKGPTENVPAGGTQTRGPLPPAKSAKELPSSNVPISKGAPSGLRSKSTSTCRAKCAYGADSRKAPPKPPSQGKMQLPPALSQASSPLQQPTRIRTLQAEAVANIEQYNNISPLDVEVVPASPAGPYTSRLATAGSPPRDLSSQWDMYMPEERHEVVYVPCASGLNEKEDWPVKLDNAPEKDLTQDDLDQCECD